jgi:hypothetical protein
VAPTVLVFVDLLADVLRAARDLVGVVTILRWHKIG